MKKVLFGVFISVFIIGCSNEKAEENSSASATTTSTDTKKTSDEILNMSEADDAKNSLLAFAKGDVNGMTAHYDDNAKYYWSSGDSLVGKQAIQDYYNGRWKVIDSIKVIDQVVLPVKVNTSQAPEHTLGKWVLVWSKMQVKYKNGKTIGFWTHADYHYNDAGKVDIGIQYIDRHQIMEASK